MKTPTKVEVFLGDNGTPTATHRYEDFRGTHRKPYGFVTKEVNTLQSDFLSWLDFPTTERIAKVFDSGQTSLTQLLLDDRGNILTRFKISVDI